jgi:hypothetical protein
MEGDMLTEYPRLENLRARLFIIIIILISLPGCAGKDHSPESSTAVGSAVFSIEWPDGATMNRSNMPSPSQAITTVDCAALGVAIVSSAFTDSYGATLATGSWSCSAHSGRVDDIPAGSGYTIVVTATNSTGTILYQGEKSGITITGGQTTVLYLLKLWDGERPLGKVPMTMHGP